MGPVKENAPSFIESMMASEIISRAITSFSLGNNSPEINQKSYVVFGGINYKQIYGDLHTFELGTDKWWALHFNGLIINNEVIEKFDND